MGYKEEDMRLLWNVVRFRTRYRSDVLLSDLGSRNSDLAAWFMSHSQHSCASEFLDKGTRQLGVCMSNSSEQANSFLESTQEKPICDIVRQLIKKMSDDRFHRGRKVSELINNGQKLTSYALSAHTSIVRDSNALLCDPEVMAADGSFICVVRWGPGKTDYRVRVTPSYLVECPSRH